MLAIMALTMSLGAGPVIPVDARVQDPCFSIPRGTSIETVKQRIPQQSVAYRTYYYELPDGDTKVEWQSLLFLKSGVIVHFDGEGRSTGAEKGEEP